MVRATFAIAVVVLLIGTPRAAPGQGDDGMVGTDVIEDDLFVTGRSVDVTADVQGDLFAAGGWVDIESDIADNLIAGGGLMDIAGATSGDLIAAGGIVDVMASVGDNLVVTGGAVSLDGRVGGKLFASAGRLRVGRDAEIVGDAWLATGSGDIAGRIHGDMAAAAANLTLRGRIDGDVEVTALGLEITRRAVIGGRVVFHGPDPPEVAQGAEVAGGIEHRFEPEPAREPDEEAGWPPVVWLTLVLFLGLLLDLALPNFVRAAGDRFLSRPAMSFGLGVIVLLLTPVLIVISIVSVLGIAIGLVAIAAYGALLLLGPVAALFGLGELALRRLAPRQAALPLARRIAFAVVLVVAALLGWIPYVGAPVLWVVTVVGLGAATWQLYTTMRAAPAEPA